MSGSQGKLFRVEPALVNQTITAALRRWLPGQSWQAIRQLIRARRISVSGNLCLDEARRLKADEVVKLLDHPAPRPPRAADVRIRFLDPHLVVVEKPAGMTTLRHPEERSWPKRRRQVQPTLDELLPSLIERASRSQPDASATHKSRRVQAGRSNRKHPPAGPRRRLRPVHRIDRETSGLMIFARTVDAERLLGTQFRAHSLDRVYLAIALGDVAAATIESSLVADRGDGRRGSTRRGSEGKRAVTHVRPIERLGAYTLVECRLETGRTHQIRIHLSERGHPVCGDKVYRGPWPGAALADTSGAPRLALHAARLGFEHPITGQKLAFEMPLPADLAAFLRKLRHESHGLSAKETSQ
jgi:23S rRNA pseudouridine1911/1915/1917 synthase